MDDDLGSEQLKDVDMQLVIQECNRHFVHTVYLWGSNDPHRPVPLAARSKVWVCGRSPVEIVGSNPTRGAWMFVCYECCVLSRRGLCDGLIIRPEEYCRVWCVVVCDLETSRMRRPWPTGWGGTVASWGWGFNKNFNQIINCGSHG